MKPHLVLSGVVVGVLVIAQGAAFADIKVTKARIGCLDIQTSGNLTALAARACDGKRTCAYTAPEPKEYRRAGVEAATRMFCTQAMEITYQCGSNDFHTVRVPGDAWTKPPAQLSCAAAPVPASRTSRPDVVKVRSARIGCLDIQTSGNLTEMVGHACDGRATCSFKAPDEKHYRLAGVSAATRTFCTQAMEVTYDCGRNDPRSVLVPGNAWEHPAAKLECRAAPPPSSFGPGEGPIKITSARIGCLDTQRTGNLTKLVGAACNGRASCTYPAPTPAAYAKAGVRAATRLHCTQAMEITYRCGKNDDQVVKVRGDAWNQPPARLTCNGTTIATNQQDVTPTQTGPAEPRCKAPVLARPQYYIAPRDMLDWSPVVDSEVANIVKHVMLHSDVFKLVSGFVLPKQPTPTTYSTSSARLIARPQIVGGHEGRVRQELRDVAAKRDPLHALCLAAKRFTSNRRASRDTPSDADFGNAFADLSVTGKASFAAFVRERPDDAKLKARAECAGASDAAIKRALDRAYDVANALRKPHDSRERKQLGWIAVSGEDDQPYRPVNVPSSEAPQFDVTVTVPRSGITVHSRYTIAHKPGRAPRLTSPTTPLVDGGTRKVMADPDPVIADDAEVILFLHGMDSRAEEADLLAEALHKLKRNWTVLSFDLPSSGYADNIDPGRISRPEDVACHNTPVLDFLDEYVVALVDEVDRKVHGRLKPRIKAIVGGSLGGNLALRLGRRDKTDWIRAIVPWSPASIWPAKIAQKNAVAAGCDTPWNMLDDRAVDMALDWSGKDPFFKPENELQVSRRSLFYGGFDWAPVFGLGGPPQAQCWFSDKFKCKKQTIAAARLDREETYDRNFRAWHWRLAAEQLAFSHQQNNPVTKKPLYLDNRKPTLLMCGYDDTCGDLCEHTRNVATKMVKTPGYARFLKLTGHSLDTEYPNYVAREIDAFLE